MLWFALCMKQNMLYVCWQHRMRKRIMIKNFCRKGKSVIQIQTARLTISWIFRLPGSWWTLRPELPLLELRNVRYIGLLERGWWNHWSSNQYFIMMLPQPLLKKSILCKVFRFQILLLYEKMWHWPSDCDLHHISSKEVIYCCKHSFSTALLLL